MSNSNNRIKAAVYCRFANASSLNEVIPNVQKQKLVICTENQEYQTVEGLFNKSLPLNLSNHFRMQISKYLNEC